MQEKLSIQIFKDENFGPFLPYVQDNMVTDINFNGETVWIDDLKKGRYRADIDITEGFIRQFCSRIANVVSCNYNKNENLMEAETPTLRISIVHESVTNTGTSISIRKTEPICRLNKSLILGTNYCCQEGILFLEKAVRAHLNIVMCGLPGSGKTELLKYLTSFIPENERVITIEDNLEIHYREINPGKDCVELKVNEEFFPYTKAIKACLRQNPKWIMLSEARSVEVKYLLEALSTGTHCLTTLHTDDVRKVPDRIQNMMPDSLAAERAENDIFSFVNVGVLLRKKVDEKGVIKRYVDQICVYSRMEQEKKNEIKMIVQDGKYLSKAVLPHNIENKFRQEGIESEVGNKKEIRMLESQQFGGAY